MHIDKYWSNGWCDDSLTLINYFYENDKKEYTLKEILKDMHIDDVLGKKPLTDYTPCYYMSVHDDSIVRSDFPRGD